MWQQPQNVKLSRQHRTNKPPPDTPISDPVGVCFTKDFFPNSFLALLAFAMGRVAVWLLRKREPQREHPFKMPAIGLIAPLGIITSAVLIWQFSALSQ
jgi:hypothetical protein